MIDAFLKIIKENFVFSADDLRHIRKTLSKCELHIVDNCYLAVQDFGNGILYRYLTVIAKEQRGRGIFEKLFCQFLTDRQPNIVVSMTCHPAILKVFIRVMEKFSYQSLSNDEKIIEIIVKKIKEDEGEVGNIEIVNDYIIWRNFYGNLVPQKDKDFYLPPLLFPGDAFLLIFKKKLPV